MIHIYKNPAKREESYDVIEIRLFAGISNLKLKTLLLICRR